MNKSSIYLKLCFKFQKLEPLVDDRREDRRFATVLEAVQKTAARHRANLMETLQVAAAKR